MPPTSILMLEPSIIYEDEKLLALNKPSGLLVHGYKTSAKYHVQSAKGESEYTLVDWLLKHRPEVKGVGDEPLERPGIVHRLDRDTSGVLLVPKTQEYFLYCKSLFKEHRIQKTYYAWVWGAPRERQGTIDAPIGIRTGTMKRSIRSSKMAKSAITDYAVMREAEKDGVAISLLRVMPKTGRTHQIRVHLTSIGYPVLGDALYGGKRGMSLGAPRLMLHAFSLEFPMEDGRRMKMEAEPDEAFKAFA